MPARELEKEVVLRARDGDAEAFTEIVRAYETRIYNLAYHWTFSRDEAADLTQEVFLRLYRNLGKFDPTREFGPWFLTVAANLCRNWIAKARLKTVSLAGSTGGSGDEGRDRSIDPAAPDPALDSKNDVQGVVDEVNRAVGALPADYRMVVALHYHEEMDVARIAEVMSIPVGTVKTWLFRAREKLRARLRRCLPEQR
ncbi:MAG: sigma-70 family RNA polymerase sigma factor [Planctomycetes bacterium]|nr:sigma-70 family RNA polymerase sigma factor [Planctomycetota bacterium]